MPEIKDISIESVCESFDISDLVKSFESTPNQKVCFGVAAIESIGEHCAALGTRRILIVTDPGVVSSGGPYRAAASILDSGGAPFIFDDTHENPTTDDVNRCAAFARDSRIDLIVGLGGGSSLDTAKGCNFILTNGGEMKDYWGVNKATKPMLPFIAVPTTSGTGSECQSFALIADANTHAKMACGDTKAAATVVILDPELTLTQPSHVTCHTGIDAITHALESAVCKKRTTTSREYSKAAWQLLDAGLEKVIASPDDLYARSQMQLGAAFAGAAIENSMLGVAHSCANPLTAHFDIIHGQAVGVMLPHVIRYNSQDQPTLDTYRDLHPRLNNRVKTLLNLSGLSTTLSELNFDTSMIDQLAKEAAAQWTAQFNPVEVDVEDLKQIYQAAI